MFRELRHGGGHGAPGVEGAEARRKTLPQAVGQILVADISMSLDNVLAVAGAAKDHPWVLVTGLAISVVLMGVAATLIANLLNRHRWIAWVGLLVILYVAVDMIWHGTSQVAGEVPGAYAYLLLPLGYLALPNVFPAWMWAAATLAHVAIYTLVATLIVGLVRGDREEAAASAERWPASANGGLHVPTERS
jgi:predicted tellurium resistance membrane protein TerC